MADRYGKSIGFGNFQPGIRMVAGEWLTKAFEKVLQGGLSRRNTITATPGGTKAAAYQLDASLNRISVCATQDDSVLMPKAIRGSLVTVINSGAARAAVYGKDADTIDGASTATAFNIAAGKSCLFVCVSTGFWHSLAGA